MALASTTATLKLVYVLFLYPPMGQYGNVVIVDKYDSAKECQVNQKILENELSTSRSKCVEMKRSGY